MRFIFFPLITAVLVSCGNVQPSGVDEDHRDQESIASVRSRVYDYGDIKNFHACKAAPRRNLSVQEKCILAEMAKNCTRETDCLITCESSPDGYKVGGGCYHVCFGPDTGNKWENRPKVDIKECR